MATELTHGFVEVEPGLRLHYVEAGAGPLVVLLHGFPEFWFTWRHQLAALAAAGFRAVAIDQRGYNLSDKPRGLAAYKIGRLAHDVSQVITQLGADRASVIGHDWGGGSAWAFALRYPTQLNRLAILNAPHPHTFITQLSRPGQLRKSWYLFLFQLPWLPEALLRRDAYALIRRQFPQPEYVEALSRPGALTAALNYYRAMFRIGPADLKLARQRVDAPVLVIWGEPDRFLLLALAQCDPRLVPHVRLERVPNASHWVHLDQPERVNALLIDFLSGS